MVGNPTVADNGSITPTEIIRLLLLLVFTNDPTAEALSHPNAKLVSVRLANRTKPDQRAEQASRACMI